MEKESLKTIIHYLNKLKFDNETMISSLDINNNLINHYNLNRVYNYKASADTLVKLSDNSVINFKYKANDSRGKRKNSY